MKWSRLIVSALVFAVVPWAMAAIPTPYVTLSRTEREPTPKGLRETHSFVGVQKGHVVVGQSP